MTRALVQEFWDLRLPGDTEMPPINVVPDDESLMAPVRGVYLLNHPRPETLRSMQGISAYGDQFVAVLLDGIWQVSALPAPVIQLEPEPPQRSNGQDPDDRAGR